MTGDQFKVARPVIPVIMTMMLAMNIQGVL
jgi:hypothetical protein